MVVYTYNPSTREAEAKGLWAREQPGLHSENRSQKNKRIKYLGINFIKDECEGKSYLSIWRVILDEIKIGEIWVSTLLSLVWIGLIQTLEDKIKILIA
jgi:hypothetical protein